MTNGKNPCLIESIEQFDRTLEKDRTVMHAVEVGLASIKWSNAINNLGASYNGIPHEWATEYELKIGQALRVIGNMKRNYEKHYRNLQEKYKPLKETCSLNDQQIEELKHLSDDCRNLETCLLMRHRKTYVSRWIPQIPDHSKPI